MSLFRFGFTRKSDREEFQAAQELNPTEPGDERKAETDVSTGKCKRIRKYQSSWERDFPWLGYDKEKNTMKCRLCRSFPEIADKTSSLYIGTSGFRRTTIQAHAKSKSHFKCFEANSAKENPAAAPMGIALRNMNAQVKEKLRKLLNSSYFVSKENLAFAKFPQLYKLQMKNGLDLGETYLNDHRCKEFIQAISSVMKNDLHSQIRRRPLFFSIMADQAFGCGVIQEEIIFLRNLESGLAVKQKSSKAFLRPFF